MKNIKNKYTKPQIVILGAVKNLTAGHKEYQTCDNGSLGSQGNTGIYPPCPS